MGKPVQACAKQGEIGGDVATSMLSRMTAFNEGTPHALQASNCFYNSITTTPILLPVDHPNINQVTRGKFDRPYQKRLVKGAGQFTLIMPLQAVHNRSPMMLDVGAIIIFSVCYT
jgi:hypothetical protein